MARTRWPPICETPASCPGQADRTGSAGGCLKTTGTRPTGQCQDNQAASGLIAGQTGSQRRPYARTHAKPRKQGRKLYPHPPCRLFACSSRWLRSGTGAQIILLCAVTTAARACRPASDDDLPLPQVDVARLGVLRVVADRGQPRAGCPVAARRRPGGRPGLGPSPPGLTAADSKCMGARGWTAVAENHRDGDQSNGSNKPDQDYGSLQATTVVQRLSAASAIAAPVWRVAQR